MAVLGRNFRLANLVDIYDVSFAASELVAGKGGLLANYAQMWLAGFFLPFGFALCVRPQRYWLAAAALSSYVFLFGACRSKSTLVEAPPVVVLAW